jgi:hypothetical protein
MFFKTHSRINPKSGQLSIYYRLVENNRNAVGGISQRSIMGVGFMDDVSAKELHLIADGLNALVCGQRRLKAKVTDNGYYLKVSSPCKALKESSMNTKFCSCYEEELAAIVKGIASKGGTKKYDKVNQRIGRLAQKYASVNSLYKINIEKNEKDVCISMTYEKKTQEAISKKDRYGVYFLRSSIDEPNEELVWTIYNCIRDIESSIRCLKSDLDLRPVFHKTDEAGKAHIHLGLMAYWIVNTVRYQLKGKGITSDWRELLRVMSTQKCVTTAMDTDKGQRITVRRCSRPEPKVARLYDALQMKQAPFFRKKSVVLKIEPEKRAEVEKEKDTG